MVTRAQSARPRTSSSRIASLRREVEDLISNSWRRYRCSRDGRKDWGLPGRHWRRYRRHRQCYRWSIRHTAVIPIAGDQVTNDIAVALRTPAACRRDQARYACALPNSPVDETIEVPSIGDRPPRRCPVSPWPKWLSRYEGTAHLIQSVRPLGLGGTWWPGCRVDWWQRQGWRLIDLAEEVFTCRCGWVSPVRDRPGGCRTQSHSCHWRKACCCLAIGTGRRGCPGSVGGGSLKSVWNRMKAGSRALIKSDFAPDEGGSAAGERKMFELMDVDSQKRSNQGYRCRRWRRQCREPHAEVEHRRCRVHLREHRCPGAEEH